jgi:hypothetical protein
MQTLLDTAQKQAVLQRLPRLQPSSVRQWGKMSAGQMMAGVVNRFCERGPSEAAKSEHSFLGRLSGQEWGVMMYKHLDHHLRQFGA